MMASSSLKQKNQRGFLTVTAVILIAVIALFIAALILVVITSTRSSTDLLTSAQALGVADAGLEAGVYATTTSNFSVRSTCSGLASNYSNVSLGTGIPGTFSLSGASNYASPATTLSANITASTTIIPLHSSAAYDATGGRVVIDREAIDYMRISSATSVCGSGLTPCLVGVQRGAAGTTASAHASGIPVGQYQCNITSVGTVPVATLNSQRTAKQVSQLEEAWAVGDKSSGDLIYRWDGTSWARQGPFGGVPDKNLNAVDMLSYASGWAVGDDGDDGDDDGSNLTIAYWNGSVWSAVTTPAIKKALFGISCVNSDYCWAVGEDEGNKLLLVNWNGTTWARDNSAPGVKSDLFGVDCVATNYCWAVGQDRSNKLLLVNWDGVSWTRDNSVPGVKKDLNAVSCAASNDCWAVGDDDSNKLLMVHWDGGSWSRDNSVPVIKKALKSVFCLSGSDCWAVGDKSGSALFVHYNGSSWSRVLPDGSVPSVTMNSVHCARSDNCWAVGDKSGGNGVLVHWDGSTWSRVVPTGAAANANLSGVYITGPRSQPDSAWREDFH